jgi:hypothetical protein
VLSLARQLWTDNHFMAHVCHQTEATKQMKKTKTPPFLPSSEILNYSLGQNDDDASHNHRNPLKLMEADHLNFNVIDVDQKFF